MDVLHECGCLSETLQHGKMDFFPWRPVNKNNRMGNISTEVMELSGTMRDFTVNSTWKTRIHSALCDSVSWFNCYGLSQEKRKFLNVISSRQWLSVILIISETVLKYKQKLFEWLAYKKYIIINLYIFYWTHIYIYIVYLCVYNFYFLKIIIII